MVQNSRIVAHCSPMCNSGKGGGSHQLQLVTRHPITMRAVVVECQPAHGGVDEVYHAGTPAAVGSRDGGARAHREPHLSSV